MMRASHKQRGFVAAMLHRLSGIALAVFLPLHFLALAAALNGAQSLDDFLAITRLPVVAALEICIVIALATHLGLGLRVLAIEFFDFREKTLAVISAGITAALAVGAILALNMG
jgi:fumarate reductase subunit D